MGRHQHPSEYNWRTIPLLLRSRRSRLLKEFYYANLEHNVPLAFGRAAYAVNRLINCGNHSFYYGGLHLIDRGGMSKEEWQRKNAERMRNIPAETAVRWARHLIDRDGSLKAISRTRDQESARRIKYEAELRKERKRRAEEQAKRNAARDRLTKIAMDLMVLAKVNS